MLPAVLYSSDDNGGQTIHSLRLWRLASAEAMEGDYLTMRILRVMVSPSTIALTTYMPSES